jgi:hypothetical protein
MIGMAAPPRGRYSYFGSTFSENDPPCRRLCALIIPLFILMSFTVADVEMDRATQSLPPCFSPPHRSGDRLYTDTDDILDSRLPLSLCRSGVTVATHTCSLVCAPPMRFAPGLLVFNYWFLFHQPAQQALGFSDEFHQYHQHPAFLRRRTSPVLVCGSLLRLSQSRIPSPFILRTTWRSLPPHHSHAELRRDVEHSF